MNCLLHGMEGERKASSTSATRSAAPAAGLPKSRHHPHQPALRHRQGRRRPDPRRPDLQHQQQAARLPAAHLPAPQATAAAPPSCCPTTCCSKTASARDPRRPHGQVQPAHHPAPAHRHLLRPGRQDQRALLRPSGSQHATGQHQGSLGLRPARQHAPLRQAHPAHPRPFRRLRNRLRLRHWRNENAQK